MKLSTLFSFLFVLIVCALIPSTYGIFGGDKKKEEGKGQCSAYKKPCGGALGHTCCKAPYKCGKSTAICGKDKMCCLSEVDIQRHKQTAGQDWLKKHNG